jgi:peptidyl-tRNA hydrolase, PTH1 family
LPDSNSQTGPWLVVGLGNPGSKYENTRHNIGFMCIDRMAPGLSFKSEHKALVTRTQIGSTTVLLAKPQTFMNLSGESVQPLTHFYKISLENLIVIHDEADLPFLNMRVQKNRSSGGSNGVKSITQMLGSQDYCRVRLGIGRPSSPMDTADYVLQNFSKDEQKLLPEFLDRGRKACETLILKGLSQAATLFNRQTDLPGKE